MIPGAGQSLHTSAAPGDLPPGACRREFLPPGQSHIYLIFAHVFRLVASPLTRKIWLVSLFSLIVMAVMPPSGLLLRGGSVPPAADGLSSTEPLRAEASSPVFVVDLPHMRLDGAGILQTLLLAVLISGVASLAVAHLVVAPAAGLARALTRAATGEPDALSDPTVTRLLTQRGELGDAARAARRTLTALQDRIAAKDRFAADMAHEVRNPLASLRLAASGLRDVRDIAQIAALLDIIEQDVCRLDRLISDTASAALLEADLRDEEKAEFDLTDLLATLCNHLALQARVKGVDFIRFLPEDPVRVLGLEGRVAQVFVNLIANAISFCNAGDAVRVQAIRREGRVLVAVEDTGPGLPDSALEKVFARFYSERPAHEFGTHSGLGLAISHQIIEAHKGVIWAENIRVSGAEDDSPPLGARFVVGLPLWAGP